MTFQQELNRSLLANGSGTAIDHPDGQLSYAELAARAAAISSWLLTERPGPLIGIFLRSRIDLIAAIIGVANARRIFVPLDPALPEKRLSGILRDLRPDCILCANGARPPQQASGEIRVCYLEEIAAARPQKEDLSTCTDFDTEDSLYVYFTSGSTGIPKGIIGSNGGLLQFLRWEINEFEIDRGDRFSQFISPYFDAFLRDIFVPLMTGGTICLPPGDDDFFTPVHMQHWINENNIGVIHCVPSVFRIFNSRTLSPDDYPELRYIMLSGEKIIPSELAGWYDTLGPRVQLVNFYGATETTMIRAFYRINPEDVNRSKMPIGGPIADTRLLVAKEDGTPCGPLVTGDLYIISPYITKGYLNAPDLTQRVFLRTAPGTPDAPAFKTGDKARWTSEGQLDLLGRGDRQIKLRGIRIEPDEIENVLIRSGWLAQAIVLVSKSAERVEEGTESLAAFVIPRDGLVPHSDLLPHTDLAAALAAHLKDRLPAYMIPARITVLEQFPQLPNGKTDLQALLAIPPARPLVLPASPQEEGILAIWKDILGDRPISTDDNFLAVGGTSISMMRLIARLYKTFHTRIALGDVFSNLTVASQASLIRQLTTDSTLKIKKADIQPAYHVSAVQERLYTLYEKDKRDISFNLPMAWETDDQLDKTQVESALRQIIRRHESLRTEFRFVNGGLRQIVKEDVDFHVQELGSPGRDVHSFIQPFDLATAPLIRCGILSTGDKKKLVIIDLHHIICDGTSQVILLSEFLRLFKGELPEPPRYTYKDYAEWEYHFRTTEDYIRQREFWLKMFEGPLPLLELPVDSLTQSAGSSSGANAFFNMERSAWQPIFDHLQPENITHFSAMFAVFYLFLAQLTGQEDIVIGINTSGRTQAELDNVIGMFVKSLPIRYRLDPNMTFGQFARDIHHLLLEAQSRQMYDLADILRDLNAGRPEPVTSLFDAMFVFLDFDSNGAVDDHFLKHEFEQHTSKYPISLFAAEAEQSVNFRLEYATRYFTKDDAELLTLHFRRLCRKIAEAPGSQLLAYFEDPAQTGFSESDTISFTF